MGLEGLGAFSTVGIGTGIGIWAVLSSIPEG